MGPGLSAEQLAGVRPGDVLAGKYRVERVLGVGGMGVVVAAHHIQLDEKVALKFLLPAALGNPETLARFDREARAAVKIKSEHVARVSDVGRLENDAPYMVMEYLEGIDLGAWLAERGPMPVEQATEFVLQACEAIAEAHALGIVHRDLKPANLFCVRRADGLLAVKVLDFGISKTALTGTDLAMTQVSAVVGSPLYMSPEQIQSSKDVDARTDLWALGVILFELVSGTMPFEAETVTQLAVQVATVSPPSFKSRQVDVPEGFERAVMLCLEKDRNKRFQNVGQLALALREFAPAHALGSVDRIQRTLAAAVGRTSGVQSRPDEPGEAYAPTLAAVSGEVSLASSSRATRGTRARRARAGRIRLGAIAGAGVVLVVVGVGVMLARGRPATTESRAGATGSAAATPAAAVVPAEPASATASSAPAATAPVAPSAQAPIVAPSVTVPPGTRSTTNAQPRAMPSAAPRAAGSAPAQPSPAPRANCDPPYFIDSVGHRQYKPECL
jgi:serine/threonine-protein kinase